MSGDLAPVICPHGHRQPIRMAGEEVARLRPFLSFRCPRCRAIFAGRVVVQVIVTETFVVVPLLDGAGPVV